MGLISKLQTNTGTKIPVLQLSSKECDVLLQALATSQFPVKEIQDLYTTILKIQEYKNIVDGKSES